MDAKDNAAIQKLVADINATNQQTEGALKNASDGIKQAAELAAMANDFAMLIAASLCDINPAFQKVLATRAAEKHDNAAIETFREALRTQLAPTGSSGGTPKPTRHLWVVRNDP